MASLRQTLGENQRSGHAPDPPLSVLPWLRGTLKKRKVKVGSEGELAVASRRHQEWLRSRVGVGKRVGDTHPGCLQGPCRISQMRTIPSSLLGPRSKVDPWGSSQTDSVCLGPGAEICMVAEPRGSVVP